MDSLTDQQLLRDYTERRSEPAFAELVRRHVDLVYSAALRMVCDTHLAEDVAQGAFVALAQNARQLSNHPVLSGWLHRTARNLAANVVRTDVRRRAREQEAATMNELLAAEPEAIWEKIAPHLDAALDELSDLDRDALLLRYFERKSAHDIAQSFGISDAAAQKRVTRAVERLREFFSKRGVGIGAGGLVVLISANDVQSAPIALSATISTAAILGGTATHASSAIAVTKVIAMTTLQKTLIAAAFAAAAGTGIYEAHQTSRLREQVQTFQQGQTPLTAQIQQLQQERDDATNQLASLTDELEKLNSNNVELLKLRSELALMRQGQGAIPTTVKTTATEPIANNEPLSEEAGRELGRAVVRGEAGAFDKLLAESKAEHKNLNTNNVGLDNTKKDESASRIFAPLDAAFQVIEDAAVEGNPSALEALSRSLQIQELKGLAVRSLGQLAGNGNAGALEILLHPEKYGVLLSSSVSQLQPAADKGNQNAIDALAAVAKNQKAQPLWFSTANSLANAAAAGNPVAIDALINMSSSTNRNIQNAVAEALRRPAANQNAQAAEALRLMGQSVVPPLGQ